ncbi:hypothetical protein [Micromonospora cathayae]|uniref:Uncharacterized protein n=1 Tax=Micromonospora cathayae TaxID=3028804 RepID=A0ABY7ZWV9_9ACTN|nr:hypothetical protein [Micromonospora sp. HUAS 3]WDZ86498.1 hypothetical protein PVK37_08925 [Micromonospora sp. HUAS 3]
MQISAALDVIEALLRASAHPDFPNVTRYGTDTAPGGNSPPGVKVTHRSGSSTLIWVTAAKPDAATVALPAEMPPPPQRVQRMVMFAVQLFDFARPDAFTSWEPCIYPGVHISPAGLRITASDGTKIHLRVTNAAGAAKEPEQDPHPDYQFPDGVRSWPQEASAASAAHG